MSSFVPISISIFITIPVKKWNRDNKKKTGCPIFYECDGLHRKANLCHPMYCIIRCNFCHPRGICRRQFCFQCGIYRRNVRFLFKITRALRFFIGCGRNANDTLLYRSHKGVHCLAMISFIIFSNQIFNRKSECIIYHFDYGFYFILYSL